jgi:hypothetical protein
VGGSAGEVCVDIPSVLEFIQVLKLTLDVTGGHAILVGPCAHGEADDQGCMC